MTKKQISILSSFGLVFTTVIWGFAFVVVKNSLDYIPPIYMLAFRFSIATVALGLLFFKKIQKTTLHNLKSGILLGVFLFLAYGFQTIGCKYTTAGKNAFLTTIYVVLVPFLGWGLTKKKPDIYSVIAAIIAIVGIGLLSLQGDLSVNIGDVLTLICGICYAIHLIFIGRFSSYQDPVLLTVLQLATAALLSWICAPFMDGAFPFSGLASPGVISSMLYLGLLSTMVAYLLQNVCQKYTSSSTTALLLSLESVFGAFFSFIFLNEILSPRMFLGCVLIFFSIILSETKFDFLKKKDSTK